MFIVYCNLEAGEPTKEEEAFYVASKAMEDGFYDVSLGLLERFLKNYPNSGKEAEVNLLIGQCYFHRDRYLEALSKFESLLNKPSARSIKDALFYWIAEVHFKGNDFEKAAQYYKKIIEGHPESSYAAASYYSLGWCLFQQDKFADALGYFKIVEAKYPGVPQLKDTPFKIIECLYNLKDYAALKSEAQVYLQRYSGEPASLAYLYFYLAEADYYLGDFAKAVEWYAKVLSGNGDNNTKILSKLGIGWSYLKLKEYKQAEDALWGIEKNNLQAPSQSVLLLARALLMSETNRVNNAKDIYDELLGISNDPLVLLQAYTGKADALYNLADYGEAVSVYTEAIDKFKDTGVPAEMIDKLHYSLAWAYLKQGEFKDAIKEFQKIVKSSDDKIVKVSALCQIGDTYQDSGDYKKAEEVYNTILKDYPDNFYDDYVQYQLGLTLLRSSNYDGAIMSFLALKRNYPSSKLIDDAYYALGLAYFQRQDYDSSLEVFEKFNEEFQDSYLRSQALYLSGTCLYNLGKFEEAINAFKNVIRIYSDDQELVQKAEYEIADCFYQMGDEKEAMARFKQLRSKYPDSSLTDEVVWWLGEYYYRHSDYELARRYFLSLAQDYAKSNLVADAYYALGAIYDQELNYDKALENFRKVITPGRSDLSGQAAIAIADIYVKQDQPNMALEEYKEGISRYPNLASLIYPKIADLYYKIGELSRALEFYRKSLDLVPVREMVNIQFKIGEVLQAQGNINEAVEEYLKVSYLYSENNAMSVKALLRVAEIYEGKDNFKEAVNIYRRVVSMNVEEAKFAQERIDLIKTYTR